MAVETLEFGEEVGFGKIAVNDSDGIIGVQRRNKALMAPQPSSRSSKCNNMAWLMSKLEPSSSDSEQAIRSVPPDTLASSMSSFTCA